ncbi:histidine acid phosphatase [Histomonas meleagridis]|uniref:histidine acid phosphatase n=1 Tax=Histomonas meleagridis TaxID=135588 RepID=UPI003559AEE4|nr:histidine acid phosphatase [Histomonas meleagridis]KAH0804428.1 histidine acid phosphatase [Histomonas meleagridis]
MPCTSPFRAPTVVPNATLISLFLFVRHGARVPYQHWERTDIDYEWRCGENYLTRNYRIPLVNGVLTDFKFNSSINHSFLPSCTDGSLLDLGSEQLQKLGQSYRNYLIDETHLLSSEYDSNEIYLRSSYIPRCIESGVSFIDGLYPPQTPDETINVTTGTSTDEPLFPHALANEVFKQKALEFIATDETHRRESLFDANADTLVKYYNLSFTNPLEKFLLGDFMNTLRCNNQPYPREITDPIFPELMSDTAYFVQGYFEFMKPLAEKPIFELMFNEIDLINEGKKTQKFTLYSGHDVTLAAIMVGLGYLDLSSPPPFASHITAEIWKVEEVDYIRFTFNGNVLKYKGNELTILKQFREEMKQYLNKEIVDEL